MMELPTKQEKSSRFFLDAKEALAEVHRELQDSPGHSFPTCFFFKHCPNAGSVNGILDQLKKKKMEKALKKSSTTKNKGCANVTDKKTMTQ
jgi:hypothetical protein